MSDSVAQSLLSRVVYEDEGLLVINKPSGIAVHGGSGVAYGLIEAYAPRQVKIFRTNSPH